MTATEQMLQAMSNVFVYGGKQKNNVLLQAVDKLSSGNVRVHCLLDVRLFKTGRQSNTLLDTPSSHVKLSKYSIFKQCKISQKCMFALLSKTWYIEKKKIG